jgi:diacylglycerol kinase (ATP)
VHHPTLGPVQVIANPRAGNRRGDVLARLVGSLEKYGIVPRIALTSAPGDATDLARQAATTGIRLIVAVGGDGTVHEVVNGLIDPETGEHVGDDPVLGVVSAGSGCDLVRTFGLDRAPEVIARHLASDDIHRIDVGRIRLLDVDGRACVRLFVNIAEVGFGGAVAATARRLPSRLGPRRYTLGIVAAWGSFRRIPMRIVHDGGSHAEALCNVVVANAQFFGGGLKVAPRALPDDGRFDLQAWGGSVTDVVRAARQLRTGSHLLRPDVRSWSSATVSVDADVSLPVEADGELVGWSPATFDLLPGHLALKV